MTGTDSPVNILSLTMHDPVRRTISHGIRQLSGTTITSPGTRSLLVRLRCPDILLTSTGHSKVAIFLIELIFFTVSYKFSIILDNEMTIMQRAYF